MPRETNRVTFTDPFVNKEVKVQKDGSIHLSKPLAGQRVKVVADPVSPEEEVDQQAVAGAAELVQESLNSIEDDDARTALQQALAALDREAE